MKRLQALFLALFLLVALTAPAWADDGHGRPFWQGNVPGIGGPGNGNGIGNGNENGSGSQGDRDDHQRNFETVTLASGRAPAGQAAPSITVLTDSGINQSAVACSNLGSGWANPLRRSNWVSLQADCTTPLADATDYFYNINFNMPPNFTEARIDGEVLADDSVTVQINGTTIFTGGGFSSPSSFSSNDTTLFVPGQNTLSFVVNNVTGASGLDYVARIQAGRQHQQGSGVSNDGGN